MTRILPIVAVAIVFLGANTWAIRAQDDSEGEQFGAAVYQFFSHDYPNALRLFSAAIDQGTRDPRCYFFRGLTYLRTGRADLAVADFQKGGQLEATGDEPFYGVSEALQRIQGQERLRIENYRQHGRAAARQREIDRQKARLKQLRQAQVSTSAPPPAPVAAAPVPAAVAKEALSKPAEESPVDTNVFTAKDSSSEALFAPADKPAGSGPIATRQKPVVGGTATPEAISSSTTASRNTSSPRLSRPSGAKASSARVRPARKVRDSSSASSRQSTVRKPNQRRDREAQNEKQNGEKDTSGGSGRKKQVRPGR